MHAKGGSRREKEEGIGAWLVVNVEEHRLTREGGSKSLGASGKEQQ